MKNISCKFLAVFALLNCWIIATYSQAVTNQGKEFWIAFPTHNPDFDSQFHPLPAQISIFITGPNASSGTVLAGSFKVPFTITGNQVTEIKVPRIAAYINDTESGQVIPGRAIHVTVDKDQPAIAVYAHIFAGQRSAATLILPAESLGNHYYSMNYPQHDTEGQNYIVLVGTMPNTLIHLRKGNVDLVPGGVLLKNVDDVYEYLSTEDLTGVSASTDPSLSGCNHFAMFSGSSGVYIAPPDCTPHSLDPLYQQCYDTQNWGKAYGYIPFSNRSRSLTKPVRTAGQLIRILAGGQAATVSMDNKIVANLPPGGFYTSPAPLPAPAYITSTAPVMVAQFALSQSCSNIDGLSYGFSDPDMVFLNPIDYSIKDITVYSSSRENITEQYLNILIPASASASFLVNGKVPASPFSTIAGLPDFKYLQLDLSQENTQTFHITADQGFNAIAYGFGNVESYAYSAGTNLAATQTVDAVRTADNLLIDSACVDEDFFFRLTLPFPSPEIIWKMDKKEQAITQQNPAATSIDLHGKKAYLYSLAKTPAYLQAGGHEYEITASYPAGITNCSSGKQVSSGIFKVITAPDPAFTTRQDNCDQSVVFRYKSNDMTGISSLTWDFDDPHSQLANTATSPEASHLYRDTGVYYPRLTMVSATGCTAVRRDTIHIRHHLTAEASFSATACVGKTIIFTDLGTTDQAKVLTHQWFFGDGRSGLTSTETIAHQYQKTGIYMVKLITTTTEGCKSDTSFKTIKITEGIRPDFVLPDICLSDGQAHFSNKSTLPDGNTSGLSYVWRFGDDAATKDNPDISISTNPTHIFSAAKNYTISLTVSAAGFCDTTISKIFSVNGVHPKADFEILNPGVLCSGQALQFRSLASVLDFGNITRLVWRFNATADPGDTLSIRHPLPGLIYNHTYPAFSGQSSNPERLVTLIAYSGTSCVDSLSKSFTLFPHPSLEFKEPETVCVTAPPFQITGAREKNALAPDNTFFTGTGVSASGVLDPEKAGVGLHTLTYHFISSAGCTDSISQVIRILAAPAVNPPRESTILLGNSIVLRPEYSGDDLRYKWTPAAGLDNPESAFPNASPLTSTTYAVKVSNGYCEVNTNIRVKVLLPPLFSNAFSPNGDGVNDYWEIPNLAAYPDARVTIFNRYGTIVYSTIGYEHPWDGKYNGRNVPSGTYYYVVTPGSGQRNFSGNVTLLR